MLSAAQVSFKESLVYIEASNAGMGFVNVAPASWVLHTNLQNLLTEL